MHQDVQAFLKEVDVSLETQQTYEALTAQGVWRQVRIVFVAHDYACPDEIDFAAIRVVDMEDRTTIDLFGAELPARLRKRGEPEQTCIAEKDIEQVVNRDIIGRTCETLSHEGWQCTYVDLLKWFGPDWYHACVGVGGTTVLQGVEIVTRLRFPSEVSDG